MKRLSSNRSFGGAQDVWEHRSECTGTNMRFGVYLPPNAEGKQLPVLYFLSGLTCTEANFVTKAGAQRAAAEHGVIVIAPDTSPRGEGVPDSEDWDFGQGAGFYVDALQSPWSEHFQMANYVGEELPSLVAKHFPVDVNRQGITGHSMGGHGALVHALRHPERYRSVSAFSPICAPTKCPWGQKAFSGYLGDDRSLWAGWDASALLRARGWPSDILVDLGGADGFTEEQLLPEELEAAARAAGAELRLRIHDGYDHSYYFVASFIDEHVAWHAARL